MTPAKKRVWIEIALHLLFWAGVLYVLTSLNSSHIHRAMTGPHVVKDQAEDVPVSPYVYVIVVLLAALFYGNVFWVFKKGMRYKKSMAGVALCVGWFALVFAANYFIAGPLFNRANPVLQPPVAEEPAVPGARITTDEPQNIVSSSPPPAGAVNFAVRDWPQIQPVLLLAFLILEGIAFAYFFLKEWTKSELTRAQLQADQLSTEIRLLKSQVNPHFLFNTLNNLFSMAQGKENEELAEGISKLSGMMRYMLYDSNVDRVPLSKEVTYLEQFITLNKLRYADDEVEITFEHASQVGDTAIAPMLLVPLVENAFKHGVAIGQNSVIQISVAVSGEKLNFSCTNTDHSTIKKMGVETSGIGLENVKRRLELIYPGKHRLTIDKGNGKFMVNLEIDLS